MNPKFIFDSNGIDRALQVMKDADVKATKEFENAITVYEMEKIIERKCGKSVSLKDYYLMNKRKK